MKKVITLVEVVIALVILSVIAALAIPRQSSYIENTYESALDAIERNMFNNVERIQRAYKKGEGLKLTFKVLNASKAYGRPGWYGLGIWSYFTDETELYTNFLIPQASVTAAPVTSGTTTDSNGNPLYYFSTVTLEFDLYKGNDANLIKTVDDLGDVDKDYLCQISIYHTLTGLDYEAYFFVVGEGDKEVPKIFSPHGIAYDESEHDTGTGELTCRWKTPKELGKSQRHYEYNVVTNELKRLS